MSHPTPHTNSNTASTNPASVPVSSSSAPDGLPLPSRYWAILAIALGITVSVLDGSIANVSLPTIARDLNTTPAASIWIVNAYQLAITISLLSLSSLGDLWGYRRVYIVGLSLALRHQHSNRHRSTHLELQISTDQPDPQRASQIRHHRRHHERLLLLPADRTYRRGLP